MDVRRAQQAGITQRFTMANRVIRVPYARRWLLGLGAFATLLIGLLGGDLLAFRLRPGTLFRLDVGFWGDQDYLQGVYKQETDGAQATYRWTQAESVFFVRNFAAVRYPELQFTFGGLPRSAGSLRPVTFSIDGAQLVVPVQAAPRRYDLLVPSAALTDGDLTVRMSSAVSVDPPDQRAVGVRFDAVTLGWSADAWAMPTLLMLLVQAGIVTSWIVLAWRMGVAWWINALVACLAIALMAITTSYALLGAMAWQTRILATSLLTLGLAWNGYRWLTRFFPDWGTRRELRWLVWLTVASVGVRLLVIFYPPFGSHDLYIHKQRLADVQLGATQLWDTPSEFAGKRTIVPPAFYLLAMPFTLLTNDPGVAIQGLYALLEGTSPLLIALFVRQIGGSTRAALLAGIVSAALPIQLTILWWGFGPQALSQWLLLVLLVYLARRPSERPIFWLTAGLILTLAWLTHNGAVVLGGVALALYLAVVWLLERRDRRYWLGWAGVLIVSGLVSLLLVYGDVVVAQLASAGASAAAPPPSPIPETIRISNIWGGLRSSYRPLGYVGTIASLLALIYAAKARYRWLVAAWLASGILFLVIDLATALQVRYAYFVVPLVCGGVGLILDWLMRRRIWGQALAVAAVAYVAVYGLQLWYSGVFLGIKPTLTALTH